MLTTVNLLFPSPVYVCVHTHTHSVCRHPHKHFLIHSISICCLLDAKCSSGLWGYSSKWCKTMLTGACFLGVARSKVINKYMAGGCNCHGGNENGCQSWVGCSIWCVARKAPSESGDIWAELWKLHGEGVSHWVFMARGFQVEATPSAKAQEGTTLT